MISHGTALSVDPGLLNIEEPLAEELRKLKVKSINRDFEADQWLLCYFKHQKKTWRFIGFQWSIQPSI